MGKLERAGAAIAIGAALAGEACRDDAGDRVRAAAQAEKDRNLKEARAVLHRAKSLPDPRTEEQQEDDERDNMYRKSLYRAKIKAMVSPGASACGSAAERRLITTAEAEEIIQNFDRWSEGGDDTCVIMREVIKYLPVARIKKLVEERLDFKHAVFTVYTTVSQNLEFYRIDLSNEKARDIADQSAKNLKLCQKNIAAHEQELDKISQIITIKK